MCRSAQPALALAAKLVTPRASRAGSRIAAGPTSTGSGTRLFALVARAMEAGVDPEDALRDTARALPRACSPLKEARHG